MGPTRRRFDVVISDIDGCLAPESARPFDTAAMARLADHNRRAVREGDVPVLTVCSGRPQPFAEAVCRITHNDWVPCIAENGVWLYDPRDGTYHRDPAITGDDLRAVAEAMAWVERELIPQGFVVQPGKSASISLFHPDTARLRVLMPRLDEHFRASGWPFRVSMTVAWINCDLDHVSKATGVRRLMERARLSRERAAGIGDMPSDLVMREHVSFFACPANAVEEVRRVADYISPHEEIAGVLDILDRLSDPARARTGW
ncbi:MAG: HAD hydrolase family protein [Phycisphaerales bacterium]|nr:HAD hydrolase family protein [Phycisphaerales bacterium]